MNNVVAFGLWALVLAGCQTYAPQPLESGGHLAVWAARAADHASIQTFAESLGRVPPAQSDGTTLTLEEGEILTLVYNPGLRSARARAKVALSSAEFAGLWDDPTLSLDVLRITESMPDPWVIGGVVGFTIPLSGRLSVQKSLAHAEHQLELARVVEEEWATIARLRSAWADWSAARYEADLLRQLLARIDEIVAIVDQLEDAQAVSRLEGRLFRMERMSRETELVVLESRIAQAELSLKSTMGLVPEAPIVLQPQVSAATVVEPEDAIAALESRSAALGTRRAAYVASEHTLHLEIRRQYPDLQIGPAYEWDEGQNKIGLGLGLPIPILNANRQGIAVARAERDAARTEYEAKFEELVSGYRRAQSECAATRSARESIEHRLLPLAEAQIADERRIAELGELNVLLTLESVVRAHDIKVRLINARAAEAQATIDFAELLGPDPRVPESEIEP